MEEFLDLLQDYILVINDNKIKFCNRALINLLGYSINDCDIKKYNRYSNSQEEFIYLLDSNGREIKFKAISKNIFIEKMELKVIILKEVKDTVYDIKDLEVILDNIPMCAWIKDIDGKYLYTNNKYAEMVNLDKSQIIGKDDIYIWDMEQADIFNGENKRIIKEKGFFIFNRKAKINNKHKWFKIIKFTVLDEYRNVKFLVGLADDINEKVILKEEKDILKYEIQMEALKNEFFTNISHEFRTPLNVIITASKLISTYLENGVKEGVNDKFIKKHITSIEKNSFRLERLICNLIDITKINSGDYEINMEKYNIISLVENTVLSVVNYINSENISIVFDTNEEEKIIMCDKESIERIFLNLLSNSIKYTNGTGNIVVNINAQKNYVDIEVIDDGEGIPREHIKNMFNSFGKIDKSLSRKQEGSGLGLFIVKSLIDMHNGVINIESKEGIGTRVTIRFYSNELISNQQSRKQLGEIINKCSKEFSDIYNI